MTIPTASDIMSNISSLEALLMKINSHAVLNANDLTSLSSNLNTTITLLQNLLKNCQLGAKISS